MVLVDTGIGDKFDERFADMFAIRNRDTERGQTPVAAALADVGVEVEQVTHLILTHMHFDHGGGVSVRDDHGFRPAFPGARHYLQRANFTTAENPNPRESASYLRENLDPLRDVALELLDGEEEVLPGIRVTPSNGHTLGMQTVRVEGGGQVLYYLADLAPTHHHLHLPFTMGYDLCARDIMEEKHALLSGAVEEQAHLVFEHDPEVAHGRVSLVQGKFRLARE